MHRRVSGVFLILYLVVGGGLPLADALLAAEERSLAAHAEDQEQHHDSGHDHLSCQLCRAIDRNHASGIGSGPTLPHVSRIPSAFARAAALPAASHAYGAAEARAPPRA